ncbi:4a-hydroxytetrahydrobiopterin dehydratase [Kribbella sp. NBC_01505]|uniref:VOC family protein n=1 Tax=Kribbella sp. NBC_01505 TaxID=2903580 RepID=UPI00386E7AC3
MNARVTAQEFHAAEGIGDWRSVYHLVSAHFRTESLDEGAALAAAVGRVAGEGAEYVAIDVRRTGVTVSLGRRDVELARRISRAAAELRLRADPSVVQVVNITVDALVGADVLPFWRAVLGYGQIGDDYLYDPLRRGPAVGLQQLDVARAGRNRIHLDIAVPHDQAEARVAAALAAGGRLVSDEHAPKWWVLADAEGNEACVATWMGRD